MRKLRYICTAIVNEKNGISYSSSDLGGYHNNVRFYVLDMEDNTKFSCNVTTMGMRSLDTMGYFFPKKTLYRITEKEYELYKLLRFKEMGLFYNEFMYSWETDRLKYDRQYESEIKNGYLFLREQKIYTMWSYILNIALKDKRLHQFRGDLLMIGVNDGVRLRWVEYEIKDKGKLAKLMVMSS